jgi:hypothetical protein
MTYHQIGNDPFFGSRNGGPLSDPEAICPECDESFKLNRMDLETKEFIRCPHCRSAVKLDRSDAEKKGSRTVQESTN